MDDRQVHRNACNGDEPNLSRFHDAVFNNKVDVVKQMLDSGLNPNSIVPMNFAKDKTCAGYTLLYMACVYNKMDIVKILLKAGADPDKGNDVQHGGHSVIFPKRSPFFYAVTMGNTELMRVLLREYTVHTVYPIDGGLHYGIFRKFCDDEDVMKVIMKVGSQDYNRELSRVIARRHDPSELCRVIAGRHDPANPKQAIFLHTAAKYRSDKLFTYLMDFCGAQNAVCELLVLDNRIMNFDGYHVADTLSHLIDLHGARSFVEDDTLRLLIMAYGSDRMLQLLMNHFYHLYGDNKEWWKEQMISKWRADKRVRFLPRSYGQSEVGSFMHECLGLSNQGRSRFESLLRWGVYSVLHDFPYSYSVFYTLAKSCEVKSTKLFIGLYPQCLQERWVWEGRKPWHSGNLAGLFSSQENMHENMLVQSYFASLVEMRRHVPNLKVLCRSVILHELGIKPIPKAEQLPLPKSLKEFVQAKTLFEANE